MKGTAVLTGAGLAVIGAGFLLMWMGIKDYTFTTVLNAAIKGDPLTSESATTGMIRNLPDKEESDQGSGGGGINRPTVFTPDDWNISHVDFNTGVI